MLNREKIKANISRIELMQIPLAELLAKHLRLNPLFPAAIGISIGIAIAKYINPPDYLSLIISTIAFVLCIFVCHRNAGIFTISALLLTGFATIGMTRCDSFIDFPANHINSIVQGSMLGQVRARVITDLIVNKEHNSAHCIVSLREIECTDHQFRKISGKTNLHISLADTGKLPQCGDYIFMYCVFDRVGGATNPGQFDYAKYLEAKAIQTNCNAELGGIEILSSGRPTPLSTLKNKVYSAIYNDCQTDDDSASLLSALLIGVRSNLDDSTIEAFRTTGLMHLLSLSGMHIGILAGSLWFILGITPASSKTKAIITSLILIIYMLVIPYRSPAMRATLLCLLHLGAIGFGRQSSYLSILALAAIVTLLFRPLELFTPGWQLSFISILSIITLTKPWENLFHRITGYRLCIPEIEMGMPKLLASKLMKAFAVGLAVATGTLPLIMYHFNCFYPYSILLTILLSPLLTVCLTLGLILTIITLFMPFLSIIMIASQFIAGLFGDIVVWFSSLPYSEIVTGAIPPLAITLYYPAVILSLFSFIRFSRWWRVSAFIFILGTISLLAFPIIEDEIDRPMQVSVLSVGAGQCVVCQMPSGQSAMIDCGSATYSQMDKRIVEPFLRYVGIDRLEISIVSHNDSDHHNGFDGLKDRKVIGDIFSGDEIKIKSNTIPRPDGIDFCDARFTILQNTASLDDNNRSLVVLIEYAGKIICLPGDIEYLSQRWLVDKLKDSNIAVDVLVLPHHGLLRTLDLDFPRAISPDCCIASCSKSQTNRGVYDSKNMKVYKTSECGAVTIKIKKNSTMEISNFR